MRIVAGEWKGRRLLAPGGRSVRPTPERVREAWMSIVLPAIPGATVLDLFAGTGALGLEALSRGAARVEFVENDPRSLTVLRANISALGAQDRTVVHRADAVRYASGLPPQGYSLTFADPPYRTGLASTLAALWLTVPFSAIFGVEHEATEFLPASGDCRRYGDTAITIYRT